MAFLENGLDSKYVDIYYQPFKMLNTMFKPSIESSTTQQLVSHMLSNMDFGKYQKFLQYADRYPQNDHKFVLFEYVESPTNALISRSERVPGTRISIHSVTQNPDFDANMKLLFKNSDRDSWYTRRKIDYTKSPQEQLSDTRQLVLLIKQESEDDYSDMPSLISAADVTRPVLNPEDTYAVPSFTPLPPLIPLSPYTYNGYGLNQTMWTPYSYNSISPTTHALS
jgi:hypothetical protein